MPPFPGWARDALPARRAADVAGRAARRGPIGPQQRRRGALNHAAYHRSSDEPTGEAHATAASGSTYGAWSSPATTTKSRPTRTKPLGTTFPSDSPTSTHEA